MSKIENWNDKQDRSSSNIVDFPAKHWPIEIMKSSNISSMGKTDQLIDRQFNEQDSILDVRKAYEEINAWWQEIASTQGDGNMNNYEKLLDRLDQDLRDHKQEMRDRDLLLQKEKSEQEKRFHNELLRLGQEASAREQRYIDDSREREERITDLVNRIEKKMNETSQHIETMKKQNFWGNMGLFVGMLAIVITLIIKIT